MDKLLILAPDKDLIWRNRPNLTRRYVDIFRPIHRDEERLALFRRFSPGVPRGIQGSGSWDIALNSEGFRDSEFSGRKPASRFRIVCLGDSWTFGMNVGQDQAYPQRLRALLKEQFPDAGAGFEVFNLGVLGYSSYQGVELLRKRIHELDPDVVVIAYAMNDSKVSGYRDKDLAAWEQALPLKERVLRVMRASETYKLFQYWALIIRHKPQPIGFYLKQAADGADNKVEDFEKLDQWTRVGLKDYGRNITEMVHIARKRGAHVILLYNELWEDGLYLHILQEVSKAEQVPLVDGNAIIRKMRERHEQDLERRLDLEPPPARSSDGDEVEVVFRVYAGSYGVPRAMYLAGRHAALGNLTPNKIAMYDDGTHGDQRARDAVWSYAAKLPRRAQVFYVYTNSGREGVWEGLDVPYIRHFELKTDAGRIYRPVETFGQVYMQGDSWHTDATGYDLIAKGVLDALRQDIHFQEHLRRSQGERYDHATAR